MQETKKIDQKLFLNINGVRQGMFLKGADIHNPVLLYLHGGPGSPEIAFDSDTPSALDQMFMVCWWEQRGAGISYSKKIPAESMCINQLVDDAIAVADYLRERFKKEKIYLLGHSWGSLLGIQVIQKAPERFYAYMGVGQVAWQLRSEQLAYDYMLEKFQLVNDNAMIKKLKKYDRDTCAYEIKYLSSVRSEGMQKLGIGIMHKSKSMAQEVKKVLRFREYTWAEKLKFAAGSSFSVKSSLQDFVLKTDMVNFPIKLKIPIYVFHGIFDYQVSYVIAKQFLQNTDAPLKGFYTFKNSAHSPCFEEADKMCRIIREDVFLGKNDLADKGIGGECR